MKKKYIFLIISIIVMIIMSISTSYAVTNYIFNSNDVSYSNTSSGLTSDNVQSAISELYTNATDYSLIDTRVSTIESHIKNNADFRIIDSGGTWLDPFLSGNNRMGIGVGDNGSTSISGKDTAGTVGEGVLNLQGNPIQLNGNTIKNILNIEKISTSNGGTQIAANSSAATTGSITSVSGASDYAVIPVHCNFGFPTSVSRSGTTITVNVLNASGATHSLGCGVYVIAYR